MSDQLQQEEFITRGEEIAKNLLDGFNPDEQRRALEIAHEVITKFHKQAIEYADEKLKETKNHLTEFLENRPNKEPDLIRRREL